MKRFKWGTKMRTPGLQTFVGYKRSKWGTDGNPDKDRTTVGERSNSTVTTLRFLLSIKKQNRKECKSTIID